MLKQEKEKTELKYCLNWACGKKFKDIDEENTNKICRCHPGKFDHGSTGIKMSNYLMEMGLNPKDRKHVLWEPHWTCCIANWGEPGCKLMKHRGIFIDQLEGSNLRPYHWPDHRAKLYFSKTVSDKWKQTIKQYTLSEYAVKKILKKENWSSSQLPELMDKLKLYFILICEKPDYQLKFNDVINSSNTVNYFLDKNGNVNKEKFLKWWFNDYEEICNEMIVAEKPTETKTQLQA
jgi:hypothetical protein